MNVHIKTIAASIAASFGLCAAVHAQTNAPARDEAVSLVHRFTIPGKVAWGPISIELSAGSWRVGRVDGPPATEAQLRAVLSRLTSIEVGGRCAGWVEKATSYPCGFAIAELDLGGAVAERFSGITADWNSAPSEPAQMNPVVQGARDAEPAAHGLISPVLDTERFVSLHAPLRYLGDKSRVLGTRLQFRFRAVTNSLVPSEFDRSSGAVVLRANPQVPMADEREEQAPSGSRA